MKERKKERIERERDKKEVNRVWEYDNMVKWEYRLLNESELRVQRLQRNILISGFGKSC